MIELRVTSLDVETDEDDVDDKDEYFEDFESCSYDSLQLFDGDDVQRSEPLSARLCGHLPPSTTFVTSFNVASVHFRSDYFTTGTGFQLDYHVIVVSEHHSLTQRFTGTTSA